jgi:hypothetical protein
MNIPITTEDGAFIANTKFKDMSGDEKHLLVYIIFCGEFMFFYGEPSSAGNFITNENVAKAKEVFELLIKDSKNSNIEEYDDVAKFQVGNDASINAEFRSERSTNKISLYRNIRGGYNYSLEMIYPYFMDIVNPEKSGPKNIKIINNADIKFHSF